MYPFHDFKTLNNCHLLLSGIDKSNQNDQSMTKCTRLMIQTHACRRQSDAHYAGHLCMFTVIWAPAQWDVIICHWGLVNGLLQFRDSWWTQMAFYETLMRARPVTEGLMASLLESSSLHFPGIWRANPSRVLPINPRLTSYYKHVESEASLHFDPLTNTQSCMKPASLVFHTRNMEANSICTSDWLYAVTGL